MAEQYQERQIAVKLRIKEIINGKYVAEEGWTPNYLMTLGGKKVSRVNMVGVVLEKGESERTSNLLLDDGSGKIYVRAFEEIKNLRETEIGEAVLIIGKIRSFNDEKYVSPEIIKKIDTAWLKVRSLETKEEKVTNVPLEDGGEKTEEKKEEEKESAESADEQIIGLIKELDKGDGALIEEVKEKATLSNTDEIIERMLKNGDIFQNSAGKVKLL
ncbi:hypothetical protein GOV03_04200 [Candidatus Woesearchaeota archaeon]|nr:hypothetical protein [Candidatus Woesearchaeota archaeon]